MADASSPPRVALTGLRRELDFQLHHVLDAAGLCALPRHAEHAPSTFDAILDAAQALAADAFAPHAAAADEHEPRVVDGRVVHVAGQREALRAHAEAGFLAATHDTARGGAQLPHLVAQAAGTLFKAANLATETYAVLTAGVAQLLRRHGTPAQQDRWLPPLLEGRALGTMVLTEPQAGSSLADLRATARPAPDLGPRLYRLRGQKTFITGGAHALADQIVHLVLARLPDAPAGTAGLSLFIVPQRRDDGTDNDVALAGLIHKTGCRGTTSAMLGFGERDDCRGELLGEPNGGLAVMFGLMNDARVNVGLASATLALSGFHESLAYATERRQGRLDADLSSPQVPLLAHADVQRMLLAQKALAEGALGLALQAAHDQDLAESAVDAATRAEARARLDWLTPVLKAWASERGVESNALAMQVLGGYGYTRDFPVERHWRDNRLNPIHEGTNGIQALDLLARRVARDPTLGGLHGWIEETLTRGECAGGESAALARELSAAWRDVMLTAGALAHLLRRDPRAAAAVATPFLHVVGDTLVAAAWVRQLVAAQAEPLAGTPYADGKRAAARWYFRWIVARTRDTHACLRDAEREPGALTAEAF